MKVCITKTLGELRSRFCFVFSVIILRYKYFYGLYGNKIVWRPLHEYVLILVETWAPSKYYTQEQE